MNGLSSVSSSQASLTTRSDQPDTNAGTPSLRRTTYSHVVLPIDRKVLKADAEHVGKAAVSRKKMDDYWKLLRKFVEDYPEFRGMVSGDETNGIWTIDKGKREGPSLLDSDATYHAFAIATIARLILVCIQDSNEPDKECTAYKQYKTPHGEKPPRTL